MTDTRINEFLLVSYGDGSGDGYGFGDGTGNGGGYGSGTGSGGGYGSGTGSGTGDGDGNGIGIGDGTGNGTGDGDGNGIGDGIKQVNNQTVYIIDGVQTLIDHIRGNIAKGKILNSDFTFAPCYVVKGDDKFAHGKTLREAQAALVEKLFEDMPVDERIDMFVKEFPDIDTACPTKDFHEWHGKLTGSCALGRESFARDRGVDMDGSMTVAEFISLTEDSYGGDIIRQVKERYGYEE